MFKNHALHQARSAGTSEQARIRVNEKLLAWADVVFVMERKHRDILKQRFALAIAGKKIECWILKTITHLTTRNWWRY
jgi:predicted protein tyrosine phosphatase